MTGASDADGADDERRIAAFLERSLLIEFGDEVDRDSDLFRMGLMDSYGYIEVIRFLEAELGVRFDGDEVLLEIETTLAGLVDLVRRKRAAA